MTSRTLKCTLEFAEIALVEMVLLSQKLPLGILRKKWRTEHSLIYLLTVFICCFFFGKAFEDSSNQKSKEGLNHNQAKHYIKYIIKHFLNLSLFFSKQELMFDPNCDHSLGGELFNLFDLNGALNSPIGSIRKMPMRSFNLEQKIPTMPWSVLILCHPHLLFRKKPQISQF